MPIHWYCVRAGRPQGPQPWFWGWPSKGGLAVRLLIQISGVAGGNTSRRAGRGRMGPTGSEMLTNKGHKCFFLLPGTATRVHEGSGQARIWQHHGPSVEMFISGRRPQRGHRWGGERKGKLWARRHLDRRHGLHGCSLDRSWRPSADGPKGQQR